MILILTDVEEPTTDLVIDWLNFYKKDFIRISSKYPLEISSIFFHNNMLEAIFKIKGGGNDGVVIDTRDIKSYWYRRSNISVSVNTLGSNDSSSKLLDQHIIDEHRSTLNILYKILNGKKRINKFDDAVQVCKVYNLEIASKNELNVPDSIICSSKEDLIHFYEKHNGEIISKDIGDPIFLYLKGYHIYTNQIDIDKIPLKFSLSLFQEMIEKEFEIRIFYIEKMFFSSAIFSQSDNQTKVDFKRYNNIKPNRVVPFKLPISIEKKLICFMNDCGLNSGSIDMIYTKDKNFVFLEVNPVGQFEQVSFPCNYNIFKHIAEYL